MAAEQIDLEVQLIAVVAVSSVVEAYSHYDSDLQDALSICAGERCSDPVVREAGESRVLLAKLKVEGRKMTNWLPIVVGIAALTSGSLAKAQDASAGNAPRPPMQGYPAPGYYYPPPGYYPPPPATVEDAPSDGEDAPFRRGFLLMPYTGFHIPFGDASKGYSPGVRLGTLVGGHITSTISLNGEVTFDLLEPSEDAGSYSGVMLDVAFSPLAHVPAGRLEIVAGPKLGTFVWQESAKVFGMSYEGNGYGYVYGLTAGLLGRAGRFAVGGLVNFTGRGLTHACGAVSGGMVGNDKTCSDDPSGPHIKELSMAGVFLF